jgi:plasmid maintenance system antidote protein VapI
MMLKKAFVFTRPPQRKTRIFRGAAQEIMNFITGKRPVTMALAARLAMRFRTTTAYWLGLQALYDRRSRATHLLWVRRRVGRRPRL